MATSAERLTAIRLAETWAELHSSLSQTHTVPVAPVRLNVVAGSSEHSVVEEICSGIHVRDTPSYLIAPSVIQGKSSGCENYRMAQKKVQHR